MHLELPTQTFRRLEEFHSHGLPRAGRDSGTGPMGPRGLKLKNRTEGVFSTVTTPTN
ncbi:unnamed protein product [Arctogadus glacialis]